MGSALKHLCVKYAIKSKLRRYKNRYPLDMINEVETIMVGVAFNSLVTPYQIKGNVARLCGLSTIFTDCGWVVYGYSYQSAAGERSVLFVKPAEVHQ